MEDRKPLDGWEVLSTSQERLSKEVDCRRSKESVNGKSKIHVGYVKLEILIRY